MSDILLGEWSTRSKHDIILSACTTGIVWMIGDCAIIDWIKNDLFAQLRLESLESTRRTLLSEISHLEDEIDKVGHTNEIDNRIKKLEKELNAVDSEIASLSLPD